MIAGYIATVTYMAAEEATGADRRTGVVAVAASALVLVWTTEASAIALESVLAVGFLAWTGRALWGAYRNSAPEVVGPAVGTCILALIVLDAAFTSVAGVGWTLEALSFLAPAIGLSRAFDVS